MNGSSKATEHAQAQPLLCVCACSGHPLPRPTRTKISVVILTVVAWRKQLSRACSNEAFGLAIRRRNRSHGDRCRGCRGICCLLSRFADTRFPARTCTLGRAGFGTQLCNAGDGCAAGTPVHGESRWGDKHVGIRVHDTLTRLRHQLAPPQRTSCRVTIALLITGREVQGGPLPKEPLRRPILGRRLSCGH